MNQQYLQSTMYQYYRFKLEKYRQKKMLIGVVTVGDYHEQGFVGTPV